MKMSDKFRLPVFYECDPLSEVAKFSAWQGNGEICKSLFLAFDDCDADLICEAINNHDRMVEEIAELKFSEVDLVNRNEDLLCIIDDLTRIARALDKPERHTNSQHKRAKRDLRKLIEKLNQEGEE